MSGDYDLLLAFFNDTPHQISESKDVHIVKMPDRIIYHDGPDGNPVSESARLKNELNATVFNCAVLKNNSG